MKWLAGAGLILVVLCLLAWAWGIIPGPLRDLALVEARPIGDARPPL